MFFLYKNLEKTITTLEKDGYILFKAKLCLILIKNLLTTIIKKKVMNSIKISIWF